MASCGAQSIAVDECMALDVVGEVAQAHHIGFIGNLHVTNALFEETEAISADVRRCMTDGQCFPGYVFGLGGPLTQHVSLARMQEMVTEYQTHR